MMQTTSHPCATASAPTRCHAAFACAPAVSRRSAHTVHSVTRVMQSCLLRTQHIKTGGLQSRQAPLRASRQRVAAVRAETSYVMIKPDGVQRALVGEVCPSSSKLTLSSTQRPALPLVTTSSCHDSSTTLHALLSNTQLTTHNEP